MSAALAAVLGVSEVVAQIGVVATRLALGARQVDDSTASQMVERMRADVPKRTQRLASGITAEFADEVWTVKATASNPTGRKGGAGEGADYASFVEFGTDPRQQGKAAADDSFFAGNSRGGHPGTDPQPFFWDNARQALGERFDAARKMADDLGGDI